MGRQECGQKRVQAGAGSGCQPAASAGGLAGSAGRPAAGQAGQVQAGSWHRQAVSSAGSQSRAGRPAVGRSCARQGARAMPFCPTASNPRAASPGTLACWQALFQHHHSFFSWLCHSAEWQPAQPSPALWAARGTETARGRVGQQRSWHRYGRGYSAVGLCPGTSRTLGWVAPTRAGHGVPVPTVPGWQAEMVGTGMSCPAQHSGHLPVLFQHSASVSLHPVGTFPTTATPGKRGEVSR